MTISAMAAEPTVATHPGRTGAPMNPMAMSDNMRYIVGNEGSDETGNLFMWDLVGDTYTLISTPGLSGEGIEVGTLNKNSANDVSDNGVVVGYIHNYPAVYRDGKWTTISTASVLGVIKAVTKDGNTMVGFESKPTYESVPVIWKYADGVYTKDTLVWTDDTKIVKVEEEDGSSHYDTIPMLQGVEIMGIAATDISADGEIIVGYAQCGTVYPGVMWKRNDAGEYEVDFFSAKYINFEGSDKDDANEFSVVCGGDPVVSSNGKWITGPETQIANGVNVSDWMPVRYDVEASKLDTLFDLVELEGFMPFSVSDKGTLVGFETQTPSDLTARKGKIVAEGDKEPMMLTDYFSDKDVTTLPDIATGHSPAVVSKNDSVFVGNFYDSEKVVMYVVDLRGQVKAAIDQPVVMDNDFCTMAGNVLTINDDITDLRVITISAQTVYQVAQPTGTIDLSHLPDGVYVVVANKAGSLVSTKITIF